MVNMIIPGSIMFSDDNELAEVRAIEEGFKRAYDEDPKGTAEAINELRDFAVRLIRLKATAENELDAKALIIAIGDIARAAAENQMESACVASSSALENLMIEAANEERDLLSAKALSVLGSIALDFAGKDLDAASKAAAESLGNCGKFSSKKKMETMVSLAEVYLMKLATKALEKNLSDTTFSSISLLGEIGGSSAEQGVENGATEAALLLEDLGDTAVRRKDESFAGTVILSLGKLGKAASQYGLKNSLVQTAWSLEIIRVLAQELDLKATCLAAKEALEPLNTEGLFDEEQNLEKIQEIKELHHRILKKS
jgi:hypothetical protein